LVLKLKKGIGNMNNTSDVYFAAKPADECASALLNKSTTFYKLQNTNAYLEKIRRMWNAFHGIYTDGVASDGHQVSFTGEQGELVQLPVNHFRNIAEHIINMITANRPTMNARSVNTDYKSLAQTRIATGILDFYMREKNLEQCLYEAVRMAVVIGAGFIKLEWNATSGDAYDIDPDTGEFNYEGDLEFSNLSPLDVVFDGTKETWNQEWILVRNWQNRFNLAAKYPELKDKILARPTKQEQSISRLAMFSNDDTDDIAVYEFYHDKSEALPEGRYLLFVDADVVLLDTKLPYRRIPIFRIAPSNIMGTPYGYSPMFDVFPIQEAINSEYGTIMTNHNAFGVQNVWIPPGGDIVVSNIDGGLNVIRSIQKPESINLTETPKEIFDMLNFLIQSAETISGVNSVTRGNPEASLKSGAALALVQSMSLQFLSGLQRSYVKLIEDTGTGLLDILKDFAATPRVITLVGKNNRPYLKEFTGEAINSVSRVIVDPGNPLAKTAAGRVEMAEQMLQMGAIKTPQQYFQVITTGNLDVMFEGEIDELMNVKAENEKMLEGGNVMALFTDTHSMHIQEHKSILSDPDLRENPDLVQIVAQHIQQHIDLLRNTDPDTLTLLGQQPLQPPAPLPPDVPMPGAPPGNSKTPQIMQADQGQNIPGQKVNGPNVVNQSLPNIPKVNSDLLPNPQLQEQSLGNIKSN
jgi:hypothetical protein